MHLKMFKLSYRDASYHLDMFQLPSQDVIVVLLLLILLLWTRCSSLFCCCKHLKMYFILRCKVIYILRCKYAHILRCKLRAHLEMQTHAHLEMQTRTPPFQGLTDEFASCVGFNFFRNSVSRCAPRTNSAPRALPRPIGGAIAQIPAAIKYMMGVNL